MSTLQAANVVATTGFYSNAVQSIWIPAVAIYTRSTTGAVANTIEMTTNKNMWRCLDFDPSTQQFAQFTLKMPKSWNVGTVNANFTWAQANTTTNFGVVWALEAVAISNNDTFDAAFGTAQQVASTGGTNNTIYITANTPNITIGGSPVAEDLVVFQVKRVPADGSDTMATNAHLLGVMLNIVTNVMNDQ